MSHRQTVVKEQMSLRYEGRTRVVTHNGKVVCRHSFEPTEPWSYWGRVEWAKEYSKTYRQVWCSKCSLYVWEPTKEGDR
jgi:hypothetical protein